MRTIMEYKGFKASIMEAERLTGDYVHRLPPGTALPVYYVEEFLQVPENWVKKGGFVVPVKPEKGLWFDWRANSAVNTAVIPTVKGCNPITGLQTSGFHLERYENKCPKHGCDFLMERYCPECGYKWPPQGYVSGNSNTLWWDGFRSDEGVVRQFFFTEDMMRDIATHLIGKENTVPAFGFAFYSPKERFKEPELERGSIYSSALSCKSSFIPSFTYTTSGGSPVAVGGLPEVMHAGFISPPSENALYASAGFISPPAALADSGIICSNSSQIFDVKAPAASADSGIICSNSSQIFDVKAPRTRSFVRKKSVEENLLRGMGAEERERPVKSKEVAIGAGAKIGQDLQMDSYSLETWKETPDSVMTIYFVFQDKLEELIAGGMRDLKTTPEGLLEGLPVG